MKIIDSERSTLGSCLDEAKSDRLVVTQDGKPVASVLSAAGLDAEQIGAGSNDHFRELIQERRGQKTLTRVELEQALGEADLP